VGKFRRPRAVPFGRKTAQALDRYLRVRTLHRYADAEAFWLGRQGPLGDGASDLMLRARARRAGLGTAHAHLRRHGFAHAWLANGGDGPTLATFVLHEVKWPWEVRSWRWRTCRGSASCCGRAA
jgi:site-specific recombinase XerC